MRTIYLALLLASMAATASAGSADVPLAVGGGYETWRLPGDERLGMAHAEVLFEATPGWWLGPTVYGAASGQRGGLYVGGLAIQRPFEIGSSLRLVPGLAVGGGGGAAAPVGNGLMWRPSLSLQLPLGDAWRAGLGVSQVRFPGAPIRSTQWGLVAEWQGRFVAEPLSSIGRRVAAPGRSGLGLDRLALIGGRYALAGKGMHVDLIGVRLDRLGSDRRWVWGVEAAAAANSGNSGYMEILGHGGVEYPLAQGIRVGARAAIGFGGGGAVPTGGGTLGHLDATLAVSPARGWQIGAAIGRIGGTASTMRGTRAELSLTADLEPLSPPGTSGRRGVIRRVDWAGNVQWVRAVRRNDGTRRALQTAGLQLNWWLGENVYLTGQAHSAFGGGAGAYSQGLLGAGVATPFRGRYVQIGAEVLAGGGGGGGVSSLSGAIGQAMMWGGFQPRRDGPHLRIGIGGERSRSGSTSAVLAVGWVVPFAQVTR